MQRYFVKDFDKEYSNTFTLSEDDSYHIIKVMRYKINDLIEVVSKDNMYICKITKLGKNVKCEVNKKVLSKITNIPNVTIAQSLVKEQKMDYILQKSTELGVNKIIPIKTIRSIIKIENDNKKVDRWQKIVKEASEQSKRLDIPIVEKSININELSALQYDYKILCSVNETSINIKKALQNVKYSDTILIVIGPEGGFDKKEEQVLIDSGFISTSLGTRVLRTETAPLFVLSVINYIFEE